MAATAISARRHMGRMRNARTEPAKRSTRAHCAAGLQGCRDGGVEGWRLIILRWQFECTTVASANRYIYFADWAAQSTRQVAGRRQEVRVLGPIESGSFCVWEKEMRAAHADCFLFHLLP